MLELGFGDDSHRYDGNRPTPHPHLICICCRAIIDPEIGLVQNLESEMARASGYKIVGQRLDFYGICPQCQAADPDCA